MAEEEIEQFQINAEVESLIRVRKIGMGAETNEAQRQEYEKFVQREHKETQLKKDRRDRFSLN